MTFSVSFLCLGKLKDAHWQHAYNEYEKRLRPYVHITLHEIREQSFTEKDSPELIKQKEATAILDAIPKGSYVVALHETGTSFSSVDFAHFLHKKTANGTRIVFIIGGPLGLHTRVLERADLQLSFSAFTFPHQLVRILLLEQLYRAVTILHKKTYHY